MKETIINSNDIFQKLYDRLGLGDKLLVDIHIGDIISSLTNQLNTNLYSYSTIMTKHEYQLLYPILYQITTDLSIKTELFTKNYFDAVVDIDFTNIIIPNKYIDLNLT